MIHSPSAPGKRRARGADPGEDTRPDGMVTCMTKLLEQAIAKIRALSEEEQDALAAALLAMVGSDASGFPLDQQTESAIREGLAQADQGEFVPDEVVTEANKRHGI